MRAKGADMKKFLKLCLAPAAVALAVVALTGCGLLKPSQINAGYYINMQPNSYGQATVGSNGTQANSIHAALPAADVGGEAVAADAAGGKTSRASGLFVNSGNFARSTDADLSAAYEVLSRVKGSSAGQTMSTSKGDESPASGEISQTPSHSETTTLALPVAVGQSSPTATADQSGGGKTDGGGTP